MAYQLPDKWTKEAKRLFAETYTRMRDNQRLFLHPKAAPLPKYQWRTVAWNAAWTAAAESCGKEYC